MSHAVLQRVVVRMLHDPRFAASVFQHDARALSGLDVTAEERQWLLAADPRAFRTDPERGTRLWQAACDELAVALFVVLRCGIAPARLEEFCSTRHFHDAIMAENALVVAMGAFLEEVARTRGQPARRELAVSLVRLDTAMARLRRRATPPCPPGKLVLSETALVVRLPAGTLAAYERVAPCARAETLFDPAAPLPPLPSLEPRHSELVLLERAASGLRLGAVSDALGKLLLFCETPQSQDAVCAEARRLGAAPGEDAELVAEQRAAGLFAWGGP